jgi:hypothetical protein
MTTAVILESFRGSGALAGTGPGTLTGVGSAGWTASESGVFTRTTSGTTVTMSGTVRSATLDTDGVSPVHTSAGGGVTVVEGSMLPGGLMDISFDFESDYAGITVQASGSGRAVVGAFQTPHNFTATAPGSGLVVVRIEVTTAAMRFYVNDSLVYTRGSGVMSGTPITSLRVGYPGYLGSDGYTPGASPVALNYLHLQTEVSSGALGSGVPTQPAPTSDSDLKVLFSDNFGTAINLNGSHGETGPLASATWVCEENTSATFWPAPEAFPHWMRGGSNGLTATGVSRVDEEALLLAHCIPTSNAARFTDLPAVLEVLIPPGFTAFSVGFAFATSSGIPFAQASAAIEADGSVQTFWTPGGPTYDGPRPNYGLAFDPSSISVGGLPLRLELWPTELRLYVANSLIGASTGVSTDYLARTADGKVELIGWSLNVIPRILGTLFTNPRPVVKRLKVSGAQSSSGALPTESDLAAALNPPGPGNEPKLLGTSVFWTGFKTTYEVP